MTQKTLIFATIVFTTLAATSQENNFENPKKLTFGMTTGIINRFSGFQDSFISNEIYLGVTSDIRISKKWFLQPSLRYGLSRNTIEERIYVPILFKYYLAPKFNLQFEPQLSGNFRPSWNRKYGLKKTLDLGIDFSVGFG